MESINNHRPNWKHSKQLNRMIKLTKISKIEFEKYKNIFIEEETIEVSENYKYTLEQAKENALRDFDKYFPNGKTKKNEFLVCMSPNQAGDNKILGYLWYSISDDYIFILDFFIHSEFRGKGYGTQTIEKLQSLSLDKNIHQIRLRVARSNKRAFKLYDELGFITTGTNMMKRF